MSKAKETQLLRYIELSESLLSVLYRGADEEVPGLLEKREVCIAVINRLDSEAGTLLINERLQEHLKKIAELEEEIRVQLKQTILRLKRVLRSEQNNQFIRSQYEDTSAVPKGVFYDRRK